MDSFDLMIFDFDGTLCDTHSAIKFCLSETFVHFGLDAPTEDAMSDTLLTGIGLVETFQRLCPVGYKDKSAEELVSTYRNIYNGGTGIEKSRLFEGAFETLDVLAGLGSPLVITSNKGEHSILDALKFHNIEQFIDMVVGDDGKTRQKPNPEGFVTRVRPRYSSARLDRAIVVGDTIADIQFAKNAGVLSCWASYGYGDPSTCRAAKPNYVAANLMEILALRADLTQRSF